MGPTIPDDILTIIGNQPPKFTERAKSRFQSMLPAECLSGGFMPRIYSLDEIRQINKRFPPKNAEWYLGESHPDISPGRIDPSKAIIFGHIEPDSPLALDMRTLPAEVIYVTSIGSSAHWKTLKMGFGAFIKYVFEQ